MGCGASKNNDAADLTGFFGAEPVEEPVKQSSSSSERAAAAAAGMPPSAMKKGNKEPAAAAAAAAAGAAGGASSSTANTTPVSPGNKKPKQGTVAALNNNPTKSPATTKTATTSTGKKTKTKGSSSDTNKNSGDKTSSSPKKKKKNKAKAGGGKGSSEAPPPAFSTPAATETAQPRGNPNDNENNGNNNNNNNNNGGNAETAEASENNNSYSNNNLRGSEKGTPGKRQQHRKSNYVAPPSSESFVVNPIIVPPPPNAVAPSPTINIRSPKAGQSPPPPPPPTQRSPARIDEEQEDDDYYDDREISLPGGGGGGGASSGSHDSMSRDASEKKEERSDEEGGGGGGSRDNSYYSATMHSSETKNTATVQELDDDDFSVAPSLATAMRSVVKISFDQIYVRGKKLGYGAFAQVFIGVHRPTKQEYAIKQVDRSKMFWGDRDALKDEISNLKKVRDGPNIVQLYEVFEEKAFSYLVTELMSGGELFDRIIEKKTFSEKEARSACRCVLSALEYMHSKRVAHRDLKPENLLLADPKLLLPVKLADFGFAKSVEKKNGCRTLCGTPGYLAPEILERWPAYDVKCDVWSVGVILFLLLGGYLPFDDDDEDKVFDRTRNGQYDFRPQFWKNISSGAKDLVTRCLTINPNKRVGATEALNHEWMQVRESELATHSVDVDKLKTVMEGKRKMRAAVTTLMAANRMKQLNDDFSTYLEKRRGDSIVSHFSYMTGGTKSGHVRYVEDSPSGKPFNHFFKVGELLGEGNSSSIYECFRRSTQQYYAVKQIKIKELDKSGRKTLRDEMAALKLLRGGPHIIRLYDVFDDPENKYLIFDRMRGGNLLARIVEKEVYTEREARQVCRIAFTAIDYCHKKRVAHRDIKPENFLLVEAGDDTSVKIADFGFAKKVTHENSLKTLCGTAHYVAPEILDNTIKGYDQRCDIWSLGVFAYVLLGGYPPFEGVLDLLADEIKKGYFEFHDEYWDEISSSAKEMISALLVVNPENRMSASQALSCRWMEMEEESLIVKDLSKTQDSIRKTLDPTEKVKAAVNSIIQNNKFTSIAGMVPSNPFHESMGMIVDDEEVFTEAYSWGEQIGIGTFSVVHEVMNKETKEVYAAKRVTRKDLHPSDAVALHDEIAALQQVVDCDHIVKLFDVFDEPDYTYLVLECMRGGDLIDRIIEKRHYTEFDAKEVSRKLLVAVEYCHDMKIANRNLKPENLLLKAGSDTDVKISDFGYAKTVTFPNCLRTQCGTEGYVAPEILEHRPAYDIPCDMWSLGVIIYIVLGGYRPFRGEGEEVMRQIRYGEYKFHKRYWSHVSEDAKNLITRMLTVDPEKRITAKAALKSRWINSAQSDLDGHELTNNMQDLKSLRDAKKKVKNAVNTIIATNKLQSLGGLRAWQDF